MYCLNALLIFGNRNFSLDQSLSAKMMKHGNVKSKRGSDHFIAGGVAGTISNLIFQPFDVVKTNMIGMRKAAILNRHARVANTFQTFAIIVKKDGIRGLWRGSVATFWRVLPGTGIYFGMINQFNTLMNKLRNSPDINAKHLSFVEHFLVGALARTTSSFIMNPVSVIKTRIEYSIIEGKMRMSFWNACKTVCKEGRRGLFAGMFAGLIRDAPHSGLLFVFYNQTKNIMEKMLPKDTNDLIITYPSAAIGGGTATAITHPFDVVRTRLQLQNPNQRQYNGILDVIIKMKREEGVRSLFRGLVPRVMKRSVQAGFSWSLYETFVKYLSQISFSPKQKLP